MPPTPNPTRRFLKFITVLSLFGLLALLSFFMSRSCRSPVESRLLPVSADDAR